MLMYNMYECTCTVCIYVCCMYVICILYAYMYTRCTVPVQYYFMYAKKKVDGL